ncbi:MAG: CxxC-x17-CxxC domain-containing protein [Candidatus Woesearchaeota archaeon]|jgi:CxxC-x17-CxxC domain-containing protein
MAKDFNKDHKYNRNDNTRSSGRFSRDSEDSGSFGRKKSFGDRGSSRFSRDSDRFDNRTPRKFERSTVTCDACGQKCEVPFKPTEGKPVYCSACFKKPGSSLPRPQQSSVEFDQINEKLDKILKALNIE